MFELRPYQSEASEIGSKFMHNGLDNFGLIMAPTGSGKSLIIADIASKLKEPLLVFQPTKEILKQNFSKLLSYGITDASVFSASLNEKKVSRITFATIGSVKNAIDRFDHFHKIIIDEAHLVKPSDGMYYDFIHHRKRKVIGLTATPYRLYTNSFGSELRFLTRTRPKVFHKLIYAVQIPDLIEQGFLVPAVYYKVKLIDSNNLVSNSTGAEFTDESIKAEYSRTSFDVNLVSVVERLIKAGRKRILIFTKFVDEAQYLASNIEDVHWISGDTPARERDLLIKDFRAGKIKAVANCGVLTTGFDYPELNTIVLGRPTKSLALYYQMIGRGCRPALGKNDFWVVDTTGNFERFGKVENMRLQVEGREKYFIANEKGRLTNIYL